MIPQILFWMCLSAIAFTYIGYPLLIGLLALLKGRPPIRAVTDWPRVSALIVAHNEEHQILDKIQNVLDCEYPPDKLEVIVCSDCSTDQTNRLVRELDNPRVHLAASDTNVGVNEAFAMGARQAKGEILMMTDSGGKLQPDAIRAAVRHFGDSKVGLVSGRMMHEDPARSAVGSGYRGYWLMETHLRAMESRLGIAVVATGALEFIRSEAYLPIPSLYSNDMGAPMYAHKMGYLCRSEPDAVLVNIQKNTLGQEFTRRVRMVVRAWPSIPYMLGIVPFLKNVGVWIALLSHKYLRWMTWAFMIGMFVTGLFLLDRPVYLALFWAQVAAYALALIGWVMAAASSRFKPFWIPFYFCLLQAAAMTGFVQVMMGRRIKTWTPIS